MNVLLIITPFLPAQTPNVIRWNALIKEMVKQGDRVTVLTSKWSDSYSNEDDDIKIVRTGHNTLMDFLLNKFGVKKRRNITSGEVKIKKPALLRRLIEKLVDIFWRKNYWPDGSVLFLRAGRKVINKVIKEDNITNLISVGIPFSCHLLAKEIKLAHPSIRWHMDIQDPFAFSDSFWVNNFSKFATKNIHEEGLAFDKADSISVTNEKAFELYKELYEGNIGKVKIIPPIFIPPKVENVNNLQLDPQKINLGYFGSFYKTVRSPIRFLKLLDHLFKEHKEEFEKLKFHFFGEMNPFSQSIFSLFNHLKPYIEHHGFLPHEQVGTYVSKMDALLNFGNTTEYHLPSKVVEFLYYRKPLINVVSSKNDSTKLFLAGKIEMLNLNMSQTNFEEEAHDMLQFLSKERTIESADLSIVTDYLPENILENYKKAMTF